MSCKKPKEDKELKKLLGGTDLFDGNLWIAFLIKRENA